jgi:hypothetical protein
MADTEGVRKWYSVGHIRRRPSCFWHYNTCAQAFKRDNPQAEVHFLDIGHFALETHAPEIADAIRDFLGRNQPR